ncbi:MAG: SGNH/GDSL hydrolase family protein [Lachnospiraceae bacterium]|nr:SGNH/GDSL hydrolase family protein [Lachnospiraceae bacterium]
MKTRKDIIAHICIIAVILIILMVSIFKLVKWNQGTKDAGAVETDEDFDVETEDYIVSMNEDNLKPDDGKTTVVFLGDDNLADYSGKDGIPEQFASLLSADKNPVIYNAGFSGTTASASNSFWDDAHPEDAFTLYWLVKSITLQDYTLLNNMADRVNPDYKEAISTLESIDWDSVDILALMYGTNDYLTGRQITDPADPMNTVAYSGALNASLQLLKETYPHIRVVVTAPTFCMVEKDGTRAGADVTDMGYGRLPDYMVAAKAICVDSNITFIDNYYGTEISESTVDKYLEKDEIHLNAAGRKLIAERFADLVSGKLRTQGA